VYILTYIITSLSLKTYLPNYLHTSPTSPSTYLSLIHHVTLPPFHPPTLSSTQTPPCTHPSHYTYPILFACLANPTPNDDTKYFSGLKYKQSVTQLPFHTITQTTPPAGLYSCLHQLHFPSILVRSM